MMYKITKQADNNCFAPLFKRIEELLQDKEQVTIAIDGNCASGKSTLAALLKSMYDCNVFAMDDFFLQPFQRTPKRYEQPGGNVDYERFQEEVLNPLLKGEPFSYRQFDCMTMAFKEEKVNVSPRSLQVIEGAYSLHPYFEKADTISEALASELCVSVDEIPQAGEPQGSAFSRTSSEANCECPLNKADTISEANASELCVSVDEIPQSGKPQGLAYDLKILLTIEPAEQRRRLKIRNPDKYERFIREWMPYENKYLESFAIAKKCDMIFHVEG